VKHLPEGEAGSAAVSSRTPRSERTRAALIDAAEEEFREHSFNEAKISGIMRRAGMAHGTFYTHFDSKEDVFFEVLLRVHHRAFGATLERVEGDIIDRVDATNRVYLAAMRDNTRVLSSFEELAGVNERFGDLRREQRMAYIGRTERGIRRWQAEGIVDPSVDAECLAHCLGGMVERVAYMTYAHGEGFPDAERTLATLRHIWSTALGITAPAGRREPSGTV
jgi:AcrR family transcriptional regulator